MTKKAKRTKGAPKKSPRRKTVEKRQVPAERSGTMPEIFDSNKYDAMLEMTELGTMQGRDIRKTVSHLQRQESLDPESTAVRTEQGYPAINPTIDERAEALKSRERQDQEEERNLRSYHRS